MKRVNNYIKYTKLRNEFNYFTYDDFCYIQNNNNLEITYTFSIADKYYFQPRLIIPIRDFYITENLTDTKLTNVIFHIGMIELISYWKAACCPEIIIKTASLNEEQITWWKKLYFNGLGEFFYLNSIKVTIDDFVNIKSVSNFNPNPNPNLNPNPDSTIIPIGGGKDSIVTLNLYSEAKKDYRCLVINPRQATIDTIKTTGLTKKDIIEIHRTIHPQLLELNEKGFLNGHTPFSALLAFVSLLGSSITGMKNIALSNEASANEATVINSNIQLPASSFQLPASSIQHSASSFQLPASSFQLPASSFQPPVNHQYSKSFEFEKDFRYYVSKYISKEINYFSFLRPLHEIQIAKLFSNYTDYHKVFKSCNAGSKTDTWCCNCPKCLFTFIILSPFIKQNDLESIFGKNLFETAELINTFNELIGIEETKPFDCIGTVDEVNTALCMTIKGLNKNALPGLLKYYITTNNYSKYKDSDNSWLLTKFNNEHFLTPEQLNLLKNQI